MYRPEAMSALGSDLIPDVVDLMNHRKPRRERGNGYVAQWRKNAGLPYYEKRSNGRFYVVHQGRTLNCLGYATEAAARGRIAWEAKRKKAA